MHLKKTIKSYTLLPLVLLMIEISTTATASNVQNVPVKNIKIINQTPYNIPFSVYITVKTFGVLPYQSPTRTINANNQEWVFTNAMPYVFITKENQTRVSLEIMDSSTHQFMGQFTMDNTQTTDCMGHLKLFIQEDGTLGYTYLVACP